MDHPYCYPGTDVYRNREDIRDKDDLEVFERLHCADRMMFLRHDAPISVSGYRSIHRFLFRKIYDWAGEYRFVTTERGFPFCKAEFIGAEMTKRFAKIKSERHLRDLDRETFSTRAAEHINELNAIHPFLEGNGRVLRAFLEILATQAGHTIDLARIEPDPWNEASIVGFRASDHRPMATVLRGAMLRR